MVYPRHHDAHGTNVSGFGFGRRSFAVDRYSLVNKASAFNRQVTVAGKFGELLQGVRRDCTPLLYPQ